ncbi:MAG: prenyltransferase [Actinomycetota bacterium]
MADARGLAVGAFVVSRPISWINTAYPFAAALLISTREVSWELVVGTLFFLIPYNLAMYGINDVFDYESDLKNPRKGGIEGALLRPELHRPLLVLIAVVTVPFVLVLAIAGGVATTVALAVSMFAVVAYSAPKLRFKERPVLDSITSSTHFVSPAIVGLAMAGAAPSAATLLILTAFFLWGMAAHAFGAVQDIVPDRDAHIHSIATAFGARGTVRFALFLWAASGILMLFTPWPGPLAALVAVPYLVNALPWRNVSDANSAATNLAWRRFIGLNYACGFAITLLIIAAW